MVFFGLTLRRPRWKYLFRSRWARFGTEWLARDLMRWSIVVFAVVVCIVVAGQIWAGLHREEGCPFYDARRGWGHDQNGKTCVRRPG